MTRRVRQDALSGPQGDGGVARHQGREDASPNWCSLPLNFHPVVIGISAVLAPSGASGVPCD